jgi:hypothetical protein
MGRNAVCICVDKVRAMNGVTRSALIVTIPEAEEAVAPHRAQFDEAAAFGIPAHVTVLFPFMPPSEVNARGSVRALSGNRTHLSIHRVTGFAA